MEDTISFDSFILIKEMLHVQTKAISRNQRGNMHIDNGMQASRHIETVNDAEGLQKLKE